MTARALKVMRLGAGLGMGLLATSCSTGPAPPQIGTPAFYWQAAQETFAKGDYRKTANNLEQLARKENEYTVRAQPWRLVLTAGMARGFAELADQFEYGARANKANPTPFRRQVSELRTFSGRYALQFAQAFRDFEQTNHDQEITLAFSYPQGTAAEPPQLGRIGSGIPLQPAEVEATQRRMLERGVLLEACRAVGAGEDSAKAQQVFKAAEVKVPRAVFVLAMARSLYEISQLFGPAKLDRPDRLKLFCNEALDALKAVPESKETKELTAKIQGTLKKLKD